MTLVADALAGRHRGKQSGVPSTQDENVVAQVRVRAHIGRGRVDVVSRERDPKRADRPARQQMASGPSRWLCPTAGTCGLAGSTGPTASSRSGMAISETSGTTRSPVSRCAPGERPPIVSDAADEHASRAGPRVVHLAPSRPRSRDQLGDSCRVSVASGREVSKARGVDVEQLDRKADLELVRRRSRRRSRSAR